MKQLCIAIGVIENSQGQVLVAKRPEGVHLEGCWEFPGGKVESQESFKMALRRELAEEVGINIGATTKLIEFQHQYEDRHLHFQVFKVLNFIGEVRAKEAQPLQWVDRSKLNTLNFPTANKAILDALAMPQQYMIADQEVFKRNIFSVVQTQLRAGVSLIQYRASKTKKVDYISVAKDLRDLCAQHDAMLVCNCDLAWADDIKPHGIHLNSKRLAEAHSQDKINARDKYFSASCHTDVEVRMANQLGVKCVLIGPVEYTQSHPQARSLGWNSFSQLCFQANMPVYALGGLMVSDVQNAIVHGGQGMAGIRAFAS